MRGQKPPLVVSLAWSAKTDVGCFLSFKDVEPSMHRCEMKFQNCAKFKIDGIRPKGRKAQAMFLGQNLYMAFESQSGTTLKLVISFPQTAAAERKALAKVDPDEKV